MHRRGVVCTRMPNAQASKSTRTCIFIDTCVCSLEHTSNFALFILHIVAAAFAKLFGHSHFCLHPRRRACCHSRSLFETRLEEPF